MARASLKAITSISLMKSQCFSKGLLYFCSYCSVRPNNEFEIFEWLKLLIKPCSLWAFYTSSLCLVYLSAEHYLSSSNYMDCISSLTGSNGCNLNSSFKGSDLPELFSKLGLGKYTDVFQQQEVSYYLFFLGIFVWAVWMRITHWLSLSICSSLIACFCC